MAVTHEQVETAQGTREIPLTRGKVALVDDDVYEWASRHNWFLVGKGYAARFVRRGRGKRDTLYLHLLVLPPAPGTVTDHRNGNRLDCRRSNLRRVTVSQNGQNVRRPDPRSVSGVRNVSWSPRRQRYYVRLTVAGLTMRFGGYASLEEATTMAAEARRQHMTHAPECGGVVR